MIWSISTSGYLVIPNDDDTYKAFSVNDEEEEGCMKKSACSVSKDLVFTCRAQSRVLIYSISRSQNNSYKLSITAKEHRECIHI